MSIAFIFVDNLCSESESWRLWCIIRKSFCVYAGNIVFARIASVVEGLSMKNVSRVSSYGKVRTQQFL
jgi:hypothetical protein